MVPGIAIVVPIYLAASRAGLLDTRTVLVVLYTAFNLPFAIWLLRGFFREVPSEIREAAIIDGCTEFQVFRSMMLPLLTGGLVATGVFVFIAAWNEFLFALTLTQSNAATAPLSVVGFRNEYGIDWLAIGAAAVTNLYPGRCVRHRHAALPHPRPHHGFGQAMSTRHLSCASVICHGLYDHRAGNSRPA